MLGRMLPHVWCKILPDSPSDIVTIAFAMVHTWDIINMILIHLQYLKSYKNDYIINLNKFEKIIALCHIDQKISMGYSIRKGEKQTYYICIGVLLSVNPLERVSSQYMHV